MNNSELIEINKVGRPSKYQPATIQRILAALEDGLTQKQACLYAGICENTLAAWRQKHPELEAQINQAREQAGRKALAGIKAAAEKGDWRAWEAFLRMSFPGDYRQGTSVTVSATAGAQQAIVCTEEQRARIIAQLERLQGEQRLPKTNGDRKQ
jgi:hypothetical protein